MVVAGSTAAAQAESGMLCTEAGASDYSEPCTVPPANPALFTDAIDAMSDAFVIYDANDRLVLCNNRYREFFPLIADLLVPGVSFEEIVRASVLRGQLGQEITTVDDYVRWRTSLRGGSEKSHVIQLSDGRWIRKSECRTGDGGIVGIRTDITDLKQREADLIALSQELQIKNMQFDTALNNMTRGLCMFDAEQRLVVCNRRYRDIYGFSADAVKPGVKLREILDKSVFLGNHTAEEAERLSALTPGDEDTNSGASFYEHLKDGRTIAVAYRPMPDGGWVATYEDVTQRARAERELRDYAAKLEQSNRELQDFAFIASHDMQEPLRKIEAFGDRLQTKFGATLGDDGRLYLDRMQSAAKRMRSLINALLSYSRVSTKTCPFEPVALNAVAREVLSDLQITIDEAGARIELEPMPEIDADPVQMRQLVQNLLSNALKFRRQEVTPHIRIAGRLVLGEPDQGLGSSEQALCEITVADNGIGFDEKYLDRIFAIFQRLHGRNEYEGTGIGLAAVRKIVERHRGSITAKSAPGQGATFIVSLPVRQANLEFAA